MEVGQDGQEDDEYLRDHKSSPVMELGQRTFILSNKAATQLRIVQILRDGVHIVFSRSTSSEVVLPSSTHRLSPM